MKLFELFKRPAQPQKTEYQVPFYLAGVTHGDCQRIITNIIKVGDELELLPDPENKYDDTAVGVFKYKNGKAVGFVGWVPGHYKMIFKDLMKGIKLKAIVIEKRAPTYDFKFHNVKVQVYKILTKL